MGSKKTAVIGTALFLAAAATSGAQTVSVTTWHNDQGRTGANPNETVLTVSNVNTSTFGKLYSLPVDGQIYAQPLYVPGVTIPGSGVHNVLYVATMNDSVYAFDADSSISVPLWSVNLGTPRPSPLSLNWNILGQVGILSTPVIDVSRQALYVVAETWAAGTSKAAFSLHSLDITTGKDRVGSPAVIAGQVAGTGQEASNGTLVFDPNAYLQRPGLLELNGNIYIGFGAHGDDIPYHGWVFGYDGMTLRRMAMQCLSPNGFGAGVWQGGAGLAADDLGNLYFGTGNGDFNPATGDYGDTIVKMNAASGLAITSTFTPAQQSTFDNDDLDVSAGGVIVISPGGTSSQSLILAGDKNGTTYVLNPANLGGYNTPTDQIVQEFVSPAGSLTLASKVGGNVYYNNKLYFWGMCDELRLYSFNGTAFSPYFTSTLKSACNYPDSPSMSLSANGLTPGSAVLWAAITQTVSYDGGDYPGIMYAFNAATGSELWNSSMKPNDNPGAWSKFNPPTIASGKVYLATFDSGVAVYGLLGTDTLAISPTQLTFNYDLGASNPAAQYLNVAGTGVGLNYTASVTSGAWLQVTNPGSTTPSANFTQISVNPAGLGAGTYNGTINVAAPGASNSPVAVPVTLTVGSNSLVSSPSQLSFNAYAGANAPPVQYLSVISAGSGLSYTAAAAPGSPWLQVSNPGGTTPSTNFTGISVNAAGLTAGTYSGSITLTATGASNSPLTVQVTLTVTSNTLTVGPAQLSFNYQLGGNAPAVQYLNVTSAGSGLSYTAAVATGAPWLQVPNPAGTTPSSNSTGISINPAGLTAGTYSGSVTVTSAGTTNSPVTVPVTLTVTANSITVSPLQLSISYQLGGSAPPVQYLNVTSTGPGLSYTASVTAGAPWLQVSNPTSTTPSSNYTGVSINPAGLTTGTYNGTVSVAATYASNSPITVPVTLTVTANNLTATPAQLSFSYFLGASAPAVQYLNFTSTGAGLSYTASVTAGAPWLQVSNPTHTTPSTNYTGISVNTAGLTAGTYNGTISVAATGASNSPVTVPVTLTVAANTLTVSPALNFTYLLGANAPSPQNLNVTSAGSGLSYTASVTVGSSWLQVTNPIGTTPSNSQTQVSVNTTGLSAGTYNGTISVAATGASNSPAAVPVTLTVETTAPAVISSPVHQAVGTGASSGISITIAPPTAGNTLIACIAGNNNGKVTSITGGGVTWQQAQASNGTLDAEIWYGLNSSGSGTSVAITASTGGSVPAKQGAMIGANISEWSGIYNAPSPFDGTGSSTNGTGATSETTGSLTLSQPGSLIFACMDSTVAASSGPINGFTGLTNATKTTISVSPAFYLPGVTGSYSTGWTTASASYETEIIGFLP